MPSASLNETGGFPSGVPFIDNGDGTCVLSGTPAEGTAKAKGPRSSSLDTRTASAEREELELPVDDHLIPYWALLINIRHPLGITFADSLESVTM